MSYKFSILDLHLPLLLRAHLLPLDWSQAKGGHRLPAPSLVALTGALSALGSAPRAPLAAAITRDLRAQLPSITPSLFRDLVRHTCAMGLLPDAELVEAFLELQVEALLAGAIVSASPSSIRVQQACVDLVCALGLMQGAAKPRARLLGPLLAVTQKVVSGMRRI